MKNHKAIYILNTYDKHQLIDAIITGSIIPDVSNLKAALFSEITLQSFIGEERRHGQFHIETNNKISLETSSEGERKKALLTHLISKKPEFLIVDNVFGNLDIKSQANIIETLNDLSKKITIIQITNRKSEILPFIKQVYSFQNNNLIIFKNDVLKPKIQNKVINTIPLPNNPIKANYNSLVKFNNVSVSYGKQPIIKDISWDIKAGEFWQLIGPNGSGKSTILSLITGDNPKAYLQDITLFGAKKGSGESVWDIKAKIGYFSSDLLRGFNRLDTIENMILSGFYDSIGLYKLPSDNQILIAHQWLQLLDVFTIKNKPFLSLSVGHQRLVLIARAMVKHPPLLILDEPTNGLDDHDVLLFAQIVNKIATQSNTAILYVSHRKEAGLHPTYVYQLTPSKTGSTGKLVNVS